FCTRLAGFASDDICDVVSPLEDCIAKAAQHRAALPEWACCPCFLRVASCFKNRRDCTRRCGRYARDYITSGWIYGVYEILPGHCLGAKRLRGDRHFSVDSNRFTRLADSLQRTVWSHPGTNRRPEYFRAEALACRFALCRP